MPDASGKTRVALIAPDSLLRDAIEQWLQEQVWLELGGVATQKTGADWLLSRTDPDVVILKDEAALKSLADAAPDACFILMEVPKSLRDAQRLLRLGTAAFISPDTDQTTLELTLTAVAKGHTVLPPGLASVAPADAAAAEHRPRDQPGLDALTPREMEILRLMGWTNSEIGEDLGISVSTVKSHVHSILGKLGVSSRTAALMVYIQAKPDA